MPLLIDSAASPRAKARLCLAAIAVMLCGLWGAANAAESDARLRDAVRSLRSQVEMLQQQVSDETAHSEALRERAEQSAADARELARENEALRQTAGQSTTQLRDLQQRIARRTLSSVSLRPRTAGRECCSINGRRPMMRFWSRPGKSTPNGTILLSRQQITVPKRTRFRPKTPSARRKTPSFMRSAWNLIAQYKNKGFGSILGDSEPFLQLSRAKLQNLMQSYEDRLYDQKAGVAPPANAAGESLPDGGNEK